MNVPKWRCLDSDKKTPIDDEILRYATVWTDGIPSAGAEDNSIWEVITKCAMLQFLTKNIENGYKTSSALKYRMVSQKGCGYIE